MRVFVAFDLAISVVEKLVLVQQEINPQIESAGATARWTDAANIHMTLKFIGDVDPSLVIRIRDKLREIVTMHALFDYEAVGVGCFPEPKRPRIIWAGAGAGVERVEALQSDIEERLASLGIAKEKRAFHPHVTLGRLKTFKERVDIEPTLTELSDTVFGNSQVKDLILFESRLTPKGATYHVVERFPLIG